MDDPPRRQKRRDLDRVLAVRFVATLLADRLKSAPVLDSALLDAPKEAVMLLR